MKVHIHVHGRGLSDVFTTIQIKEFFHLFIHALKKPFFNFFFRKNWGDGLLKIFNRIPPLPVSLIFAPNPVKYAKEQTLTLTLFYFRASPLPEPSHYRLTSTDIKEPFTKNVHGKRLHRHSPLDLSINILEEVFNFSKFENSLRVDCVIQKWYCKWFTVGTKHPKNWQNWQTTNYNWSWVKGISLIIRYWIKFISYLGDLAPKRLFQISESQCEDDVVMERSVLI